jgi:hypothetical protein
MVGWLGGAQQVQELGHVGCLGCELQQLASRERD